LWTYKLLCPRVTTIILIRVIRLTQYHCMSTFERGGFKRMCNIIENNKKNEKIKCIKQRLHSIRAYFKQRLTRLIRY